MGAVTEGREVPGSSVAHLGHVPVSQEEEEGKEATGAHAFRIRRTVPFSFIFFTVGFTARYILFPQVLRLTLFHEQKSFFLGTVPMALIGEQLRFPREARMRS